MRKLFHKLVPLEKALEVIESRVRIEPKGIETLPLLEALGRVLAEDVYALIDYPPFDRSEVDGYAVRAEDTYGADELRPIVLEIVGSVDVGKEPSVEVYSGKAVEVATGSVLPRGANAVVMEEYTVKRESKVLIYRAVSPLENVAVAGSDISKGELVLMRGTRLGPFEIGILAALGYNRVNVYIPPRIAVISTGNEVVAPGKDLRLGQVYDFNGYAITAYLRSLGARAEYLGVVPDDEEVLRDVLTYAVSQYDIVVTSGGTSAGLGDILYRVVERLGEVLVHGLEVKPGKPTLVGVVENKLVIGLPGFPFSASVISITLLKYIVEKACGMQPSLHPSISARIAQRLRKEVGKVLFVPVVLSMRSNDVLAIPIPIRSGDITPLIRADGIAIVERGKEIVDEGQRVGVLILRPSIADTLIIGSHDMLLTKLIASAGLAQDVRVLTVGSYIGLQYVARGYGDIAPIHLLDPETNTYNTTFVAKYRDLVLVAGYRRRIVLAFKRGNPKKIKSLRDALRDDVRFVNRNKGSGTRILIDILFKEIAKEIGVDYNDLVKKINGYTYEVNTHTAVAAAIAQGRADMGLCIEYAARLYNLDYIPIAWEEYDFAVHRDSLSKPSVRRFISYLGSDEGRRVVASIPGYEPKKEMGSIIELSA